MLEHRIVAGNPTHISHYCLVLHGLGDSMAGWAPITGELPVRGMAWVLVQAPEPYFDGWSWFPIPGMTAPDHGPGDMRRGIERSRELLRSLIDHLQTKLQIGSRQLLLMGFSQGCMMVMDQALGSDQAFAGVVGISGGIGLAEDYPAAFGAAIEEQRCLMTHGRYDDMIDCTWAEASVERVRAAGASIDFELYDKGHSLDPVAEMPRLQAFLRERVTA